VSKINEVCKRIDEVVNIDLGVRPATHQLYEEVKRQQRGGAMCLSAAKGLADVVHPGSIVVICTGASCRPWNAGENDGPVGAAAVARSLTSAFDARPIILCHEGQINILSFACNAMELNIVKNVEQLRRWPHSVLVCGFPQEDEEAKRESVKLIKEANPAAIISVEALGANSKGVYHNMRGMLLSLPDYRVPKLDYFVNEARSQKIFTVGIGDGGNEIGMGNIKEAVKKIIPYGEKCQCPCGAGIASESLVDSVIVASVSNWGAYGLCASLARLLDNPNILHSATLECRTIERCIQAGAYDGTKTIPRLAVDGIPIDVHIGIVNMLHIIIGREE